MPSFLTQEMENLVFCDKMKGKVEGKDGSKICILPSAAWWIGVVTSLGWRDNEADGCGSVGDEEKMAGHLICI